MRAIAFPNSNIIFNLQIKDPGAQPKKAPAAAPFDYVEWGSTVYPGWLAVDQAAIAITETAPLLLTPGRRCQNGRPVPVDRADWKQYVAALAEVGQARSSGITGQELRGLRRHQRETERRVCELPQGVSRQGRHRGEWSNPMSVNAGNGHEDSVRRAFFWQYCAEAGG